MTVLLSVMIEKGDGKFCHGLVRVEFIDSLNNGRIRGWPWILIPPSLSVVDGSFRTRFNRSYEVSHSMPVCYDSHLSF